VRIGLYTFAALAFIGLIAGLVYTVAPGYYSVDVSGYHLNLPIAVWIIAPMVLLLILTVFHMIYHGTRYFFVRRKWQRDAETLEESLYWSLLNEPRPQTYAVAEFGEKAAILSHASLHLKDLPEGVTGKLAKTLEWIKKIEHGEVIDLKAKKVERFMGPDNPVRMQNERNRLAQEPEFADTILRSREEYSKAIVAEALQVALRHETFFKLKKYSHLMSFADLEVLLDRADAGEDIGLSQEMCAYFLEEMTLTCADYFRLAQSAVKAFAPDENLALFKRHAAEHTAAEAAYLYLLFRYEMIDQAREFLEEHDEDEFAAFRAFYALKKNKYNYKVRDFITAQNACK